MRRYYFGALLLCLAAPACSRHHGSSADQTARVTHDQTAPFETDEARRAAAVYATEPIGPGATDEMWAADAAEYQKMELPKNSQKDATASSRATTTERGESAATAGYDTRGGAGQGVSSSDRSTTQRIRRALLDDDELSYDAKNVQIVTRDGDIFLRGQVMSERERWEVERIARGFAGSGKVDNYLSIKTRPVSGSSY